MALSVNSKTILLGNLTGADFTAKLQFACSTSNLTLYPAGTVFDCSRYITENITSTIKVLRPGITLLFGEGDFTMTGTGNMFEIQAPNVTIIGVSRSSRDSVSTNGSTRFIMTNTNGGYHMYTLPSSTTAWASAHSLTIQNLDLIGVESVYTSSAGVATFTTNGAGGILLSEGNPNQSGSNLNNVTISNVLIEGAKRHGIMMYGGMASKIVNTRVRNAGGHGFYIAGSTTSVSLDTCYASGNKLAGFCLQSTSYSTLNNCASDSNGLGYWMKSSSTITMSSCGAEANEVRSNSSIPDKLDITLPSSSGSIIINDIGSDNAGFIKGTSYLFTGGENITGTSCYSTNPGNDAGETTFASKYTAHIHAEYGTDKVNMDNFSKNGTSPVKYLYRLGDVSHIHIDNFVNTFDPLNPEESPDGTMEFLADVLDQGSQNIFGDLTDSISFTGRRNITVSPTENIRIENLLATNRFTLPVYEAHPANPDNGTIYFNTTLNKLFMYNNAWYDTCCTTTPQPDCTFPSGFSQYNDLGNTSAIVVGDYIWSNSYINSPSGTSYIYKTNILTFETTAFNIELLYGIYPLSLTYSASENALYWGAGASYNTDPTYLVKFSLVTNSISAVEELALYYGTQTNAAVIFVNGYLYVTRGTDTIEKRNRTDLSLIDTFSDAAANIAISAQNGFAVTSDHKIIMARVQGYQDSFTVFDTVSETFTIITISNATTSNRSTSFYIDSNDDIWVASQADGLITKYDSSLTEIDQFANQYIINPSGLYVNEINGKTIVTFGTTTNLPSIGGIWSLSSYNITDDAYIGSSQNFSANSWYGPSSMIELSSTTFAFTGGKFYTICTPYAS